MRHWKLLFICLCGLLCWSTAFALDPSDLPPYGGPPPPDKSGDKSPSGETDVDNLDGTWTFTQQVDENSTPPHYLGPWYYSGTYGFEYYSWFDQDYPWLHKFPHWNTVDINIISAKLTIHAWDVDSEPSHGYDGEYDGVIVDGTLLSPGYLQGNNNAWSTTVFDLPLGSITDDGDIGVLLDIDMHHLYRNWATTIDYSSLEIVYSYTTNDPPFQPELSHALTLITDCEIGGLCVENGQDLVVSIDGPTPPDPDGDAVTYQYRWFVDIGTGGFIDDEFAGRGDHTGNTVPAADIQPGDIWQVQVTPTDEHSAVGGYATITFEPFCPDASTCNNPPVAICQDVTVNADANCVAMVSTDNGSYDPDGDPITISYEPPGPWPLGVTYVELRVIDDGGLWDRCQSYVTVVDGTPPMVTCPAPISVQCAADVPASNIALVTASITATPTQLSRLSAMSPTASLALRLSHAPTAPLTTVVTLAFVLRL